jgi:alkanesulfonate monooxygenase SsuD/methylene tetrahydromethanopterin reductase-like flavin-dependent oxidoreductase (luciferase family)
MGAEQPRNRAPRRYDASGLYTVERAVPHLIERVADPALPADALTPVERAARELRADVIRDHGGIEACTAGWLAALDAMIGTKIMLDTIDRAIFTLAAKGGLVNKRDRRVFAIVGDRQRIADALTRQVQALGMERRRPTGPTLGDVLDDYRQTAPPAARAATESDAFTRAPGDSAPGEENGT